MAAAKFKQQIAEKAAALGFDAVGFTQAKVPEACGAGLREYLAAGRHGEMAWMEARADQRADPQVLWPEAVSVISLGMSYAPEGDALASVGLAGVGNISVYARGRDYHDVIKGRLKHLAQFIASGGVGVKVFVDTAPVMEKPLASLAGVGWQGKHTNLVSRRHGSWLFLGEVFTTLQIAPDTPHADRCGRCSACMAACPTDAFPAPYKLDARRCISYLTIEYAGPIRRNSGWRWATGFMVAMIVSRCARGTSSRRRGARRNWRSARNWWRPGWRNWRRWMMPGSGQCFLARR